MLTLDPPRANCFARLQVLIMSNPRTFVSARLLAFAGTCIPRMGWLLILIAVVCPDWVAAAPMSFAGAWREEKCFREPGDQEEKCFVSQVYLVQNGERLCGSHFFMHANTNMDESDGVSLVGTVVGNTFVAAITSARNESQHLGRGRIARNKLQWRVIDRIRKGDGLDAYIWSADMSRMRDPTAMASVVAACAEHFRTSP
jgi:hypothetical protein